MLELLKKENNETFARTENDAAALASTGSDCLDLFASIGALRAAAHLQPGSGALSLCRSR